MSKKINFILFFFLFFFFSSSQKAEGAILFFQPQEGKFFKNDVFLIEVRVNTERETINAVQLEINFPPQLLEVVSVSDGGSIFSFWPEHPTFSNEKGKITLTAGIPGGFQGEGKIISLFFKANLTEEMPIAGQIYFNENSKLFLNDGQGTEAKTTFLPGLYQILPADGENKNQWQEELNKDKNPPQPFQLKLSQDPLIFDGKYFLSFQTVDLETGIDHYEVKEGKNNWQVVNPPYYLLIDQNLKSKVLVKAIDKAGNERIAEFVPQRPFYKPHPLIFALILATVIILFYHRFLRKKGSLFRNKSS